MKILYVCHRFPFPPKRGGKIRPFNMIRHFTAQGHQVTVCSLSRSPDEAKEGEGIAGHCHRFEMASVKNPIQMLRMVVRLPVVTPSSMGFFYSPDLKRRVDALLDSEKFDLIFVHCSSVAQYVEDVQGIPKILDFGDMDSQKWLEYANYKPFPPSARPASAPPPCSAGTSATRARTPTRSGWSTPRAERRRAVAVTRLPDDALEAIRGREAAALAGPWRWEVNRSSRTIRLCGGPPNSYFGRYDLTVVDFVRWGFSGAAPRFQIEHSPGLNVMHRAEEFAVAQPGREHHADWFALIDQPDARFIEHAREDVRVLLAEVDRLRAEVATLRGDAREEAA